MTADMPDEIWAGWGRIKDLEVASWVTEPTPDATRYIRADRKRVRGHARAKIWLDKWGKHMGDNGGGSEGPVIGDDGDINTPAIDAVLSDWYSLDDRSRAVAAMLVASDLTVSELTRLLAMILADSKVLPLIGEQWRAGVGDGD